jgi:hypothetical protein
MSASGKMRRRNKKMRERAHGWEEKKKVRKRKT